MFVLISAIAGVLLVILPWTPEWTDNYLLLSYPGLRTIVSSAFFRGFCSGLGLLDIWVGFSEAFTITNAASHRIPMPEEPFPQAHRVRYSDVLHPFHTLWN